MNLFARIFPSALRRGIAATAVISAGSDDTTLAAARNVILAGCRENFISCGFGTIHCKKNQFKNVVSQINHQVVPISLSAHFKLKRTMILAEKHRREMNPPVKETAETKPERKAERECCRCSKPGAWDLDRHQRDVEAKVPTFANA